MVDGVFPRTNGSFKSAYCLTLYDWLKPVDATWLMMIADLFSVFGETPIEGTGFFDGVRCHGKYRRVQNKLASYLDTAKDTGSFDVRIRGRSTQLDEAHFPSEIELVFSGARDRLSRFCLAVREEKAEDSRQFLEMTASHVMQKTGLCYGGVFSFPAAYGPESYLSSISAMPKGMKWGANKLYSERITRWRDRTANDGWRPSAGYFREIYSVNIINKNHLEMRFNGGEFRNFADSFGELHSISSCESLYCWVIDEARLVQAQEAAETSGLVLSSAATPIR